MDSTSADSSQASDHSLFRNAAIVVLALTGVTILYYGRPVLLPIVLAVLITYALEPLVRQLSRLRVPRSLGAMATILALYLAFGGVAYQLRDRAAGVVNSLPEAVQKVRKVIQSSRGPSTQFQQAATEIQKAANAVSPVEQPSPRGATVHVQPAGLDLQGYLWTGTTGLVGLLGQLFVLTFLVYFLLASGDLYKRKIVRLVGSKLSEKRLTVETLHEIDRQIERFLLVQVFTSAVVAVATWGFLLFMGVENAAVWALAAGILNSVPYFGAILVSAGLALVAFLQFAAIVPTIQVSGGAFAITSLEGMLLTPALMGRAAGINRVAMFISLLFWSWAWGVVGTLLAVPMMMMIKTLCERIDGLQSVDELLNEH